jgi:hypothetical protein
VRAVFQSECSNAKQRRFVFFLIGFLVFWVFRWDAFVPLHRLWLGYMSELLGLTTVDTLGEETAHAMKAAMPSAAGMHAKLVKADFHGSIMTSQSFFLPCLSVLFCFVDAGGVRRYSAQKQKCLVSWCVWYHCARDGEYI